MKSLGFLWIHFVTFNSTGLTWTALVSPIHCPDLRSDLHQGMGKAQVMVWNTIQVHQAALRESLFLPRHAHSSFLPPQASLVNETIVIDIDDSIHKLVNELFNQASGRSLIDHFIFTFMHLVSTTTWSRPWTPPVRPAIEHQKSVPRL